MMTIPFQKLAFLYVFYLFSPSINPFMAHIFLASLQLVFGVLWYHRAQTDQEQQLQRHLQQLERQQRVIDDTMVDMFDMARENTDMRERLENFDGVLSIMASILGFDVNSNRIATDEQDDDDDDDGALSPDI